MAYKVSKKKLSLFTTNFSLTYFILFIFLTVLMMFMDSRYDYLKQIRKDFSFITSPLIILTNDTLNYFLGVAHLANKKHQNAISFLEASIDNPDFPLLNDAYYYLSLAYLKEGDIELAKKYLSLSSVEQSKSLLSELENN